MVALEQRPKAAFAWAEASKSRLARSVQQAHAEGQPMRQTRSTSHIHISIPFIAVSAVSSVLFLSVCQSSRQTKDERISARSQPIRCANGLTSEDLALNAIATNRGALFELITHSLSTETFATVPLLTNGLHHIAAQHYFTYLVQCALPVGASVSWTDPFPLGNTRTFYGGLGLTSGWAGRPPFPEELELVSACLLARNNPAGKR